MELPDWLNGVQEPAEAKLATTVLVPVLGAVVVSLLGIGTAKAMFGVSYRRYDPHGLLPISMAVITSGIAVWSYFNPPPDEAS